MTRIFINSSKVMNMVFFPAGWELLFPHYHNAMTSYRKEGGNEHDDAPDCTTGVVERFGLITCAQITDEEEEEIEDEIY